MGTHSGREGEKIAKPGLSPVKAHIVAAPVFLEAELILECKKIYSDDIKPSQFFDPEIDKSYSAQDYHRIYYGGLVHIEGIKKYFKA